MSTGLLRKGQKRAGTRREVTQLKPILYHKHSLRLHLHPLTPSITELPIKIPPTSIPPLGGSLPLKQSRYKLSVCKDPILPSPPPKPSDMPVDRLAPVYKMCTIEDEPVDVDAIESYVNTDFEKMPLW